MGLGWKIPLLLLWDDHHIYNRIATFHCNQTDSSVICPYKMSFGNVQFSDFSKSCRKNILLSKNDFTSTGGETRTPIIQIWNLTFYQLELHLYFYSTKNPVQFYLAGFPVSFVCLCHLIQIFVGNPCAFICPCLCKGNDTHWTGIAYRTPHNICILI